MPEYPTPEANLPVIGPRGRTNVGPPNLVTGVVNVTKIIYNFPAEVACARVVVHNLATTPLKFALNSDCDDDNFHDILAGGSAQDDGLGTERTFDIRKDGILKISLFADTGGIRCSVIKHLE